MRAYLLSIAGAVILSAVAAALVPEGRMGKFVKGMTRLLVFAVIATPLIGSLSAGEFPFSPGEIGTDAGYLEACLSLARQNSRGEIEQYLYETFSLRAEIETEHDGETFRLEKIRATVDDPVIFGQDEHINMISRVEEALEAKYGCPAEVIWTGEG